MQPNSAFRGILDARAFGTFARIVSAPYRKWQLSRQAQKLQRLIATRPTDSLESRLYRDEQVDTAELEKALGQYKMSKPSGDDRLIAAWLDKKLLERQAAISPKPAQEKKPWLLNW